jgi:hypothetical protein
MARKQSEHHSAISVDPNRGKYISVGGNGRVVPIGPGNSSDIYTIENVCKDPQICMLSKDMPDKLMTGS